MSPERLGPVTVALAICFISTASLLWWRRREKGSDDDTSTTHVEAFRGDIPADALPEGAVFTIESLAKFDGVKLPMCLGVCGKVVNVSSSDNFEPGQGYGKLWAGRETTYAMAKVSLTPTDANRLDYRLEDFDDKERKALAGWYKHFTTKYPIVGTLKEYDGWDFSAVEEEAKSQTPFGVGKTESQPESSEPASTPARTAPSSSEQGLELRKGGRVMIKGLAGREDLNGTVGVLKDFVADKNRFAICVKAGLEGEETVLIKPENLAAPPPEK